MKIRIEKFLVQTGVVWGIALLTVLTVQGADTPHLWMKGAEHLQHLNSPAHAAEHRHKGEGKEACAMCDGDKKAEAGHSKKGRHTCHPCKAEMACGCGKAASDSKSKEPVHAH